MAIGIAIAGSVAHAADPPEASRVEEARTLVSEGQDGMQSERIAERRVALEKLERASLLARDDVDIQVAYGRACFQAGFNLRARRAFERAARLDPTHPDPEDGLGYVWKRDWLAYLGPASLDSSIAHFMLAADLDTQEPLAWLKVAPLLYEQGRLRAASRTADHALQVAPEHGEALACAAYLAYRRGEVERAETLFAEAFERLPAPVTQRFHDVSPLVPLEDQDLLQTLFGEEREAFAKRFWRQSDPDFTTETNEAVLEYWSRVAHARLLLLDTGDAGWDARADVYVRFGAPGRVSYQPVGEPTDAPVTPFRNVFVDPYGGLRQIGMPVWYQLRTMVLDYPEIGMRVTLHDHTLTGHYDFPRHSQGSTDPVASEEAMAGRQDVIATPGGRAVFPTRPRWAEALPVAGRVSQLESENGARLLAQVEVPAAPGDSLWAVCVVVDSDATEILRTTRSLAPSGCDPAALRTADFALDVPPGAYRVGLAVHGEGLRRGTYRSAEIVEAPSPVLDMSDVVVACGPLGFVRPGDEVRPLPNVRARVRGEDPLIAYFEVYRLSPDELGQTQFEYEYKVYSEEVDDRSWWRRMIWRRDKGPRVRVSRTEVGREALRRQYVSVPVHDLSPGPYRLEIEVRDLLGGHTTRGVVQFERTDS